MGLPNRFRLKTSVSSFTLGVGFNAVVMARAPFAIAKNSIIYDGSNTSQLHQDLTGNTSTYQSLYANCIYTDNEIIVGGGTVEGNKV